MLSLAVLSAGAIASGPPVDPIGHRSVHEAHEAARLGAASRSPRIAPAEREAAETTDRAAAAAPDAPRGSVLRSNNPEPCEIVYGYLPYWVSRQNIRWDHLSHVGMFSLGVRSDGRLTNSVGWPWTDTIAEAQSHGVRVEIVITQFNPAAIREILDNPASRDRLLNEIAWAVMIAGVDGVNIDFEGSVANGWPALMPAFLSDLRARVRALSPDATVSIATPPYNWGHWNFRDIAASVDLVFIMGYAFSGSFSTQTGPTAPLGGPGISLTGVLDSQYAQAIAEFPERIVLGVPYYGERWNTASPLPRAQVQSYVGSITYAAARSLSQSGWAWDAPSSTPWHLAQISGGYRQSWVDDAHSTRLKLDLARSRGIGGVGVWALNYDLGQQEKWSMLAEFNSDGCPEPCPADLNGDGVVDADDFFLFLQLFADGDSRADLNADGVIDADDFFAYLALFAGGCG